MNTIGYYLLGWFDAEVQVFRTIFKLFIITCNVLLPGFKLCDGVECKLEYIHAYIKFHVSHLIYCFLPTYLWDEVGHKFR